MACHLNIHHNLFKDEVEEEDEEPLCHKGHLDEQTLEVISLALSRLIVDNNLPFSMIETDSFKKFCKTLNWYYKPISRRGNNTRLCYHI